jgi:hypothetical protein
VAVNFGASDIKGHNRSARYCAILKKRTILSVKFGRRAFGDFVRN